MSSSPLKKQEPQDPAEPEAKRPRHRRWFNRTTLLGARQAFAMTDEERRQVAVHEAGHAVVAFFTPGADPPENVSVVPHGRTLGATQFATAEDRRNLREGYVRARLIVSLAGRAAERMMLGEVSSGAENDLVAATATARSMVMRWGMGPNLGPVTIREQSPLSEGGMISGELFNRADEEVMAILHEADEAAARVVTQRRRELNALVEALQENETLDRTAIVRIVLGSDARLEQAAVTAGPKPVDGHITPL